MALRSNTNRRKDIQGLRAISILLVVANHAGLPLPGGFFGVDIFFVISGFVITSSLNREYESSGVIKLRNFYFRRFKRLAPNLALMIFAVMIITPFLLTPLDSKLSTAKTGLAAIFSMANFQLVLDQSNYFATQSQSNLLLHTWSLSVEEQIYLVFPIFLLSIFKLQKTIKTDFIFLLFGLISVASYLLSIFGDQQRPSMFGHYSPTVRVWEFLAGAIIAVQMKNGHRINAKISTLFGFTGFLIILISAFFVNSDTSLYKIFAIFPVTGAAMIIIAGLEPSNRCSELISNKYFAKIGNASYAIYLWHWPIIAITRETISNNLSALLIAAVLSFIPAILSFHYIEFPIKLMALKGSFKKLKFVLMVTSIPLLFTFSINQLAPTFFDPRYSFGDLKVIHDGDIDVEAFFEKINTYSGCEPYSIEANALSYTTKQGVLIKRCKQSKADKPQELAIIGDSHAESLFPGFAELLPDTNVVYFSHPQIDSLFSKSGFDEVSTHVLNETSIKIVVISFSMYQSNNLNELGPLINDLIRKGKVVYVSEDVPFFTFEPEQCKFNSFLTNRTRCTDSYQNIIDQKAISKLRILTGSFPNVKMIRPASHLCKNNYCSMNIGKSILFHDRSHLNVYGSRFIVNKVLAEFPQIKQLLK